MVSAVLQPGGDGATALYIVAFSLFIVGIKQGTHPTTTKRGNLIAAAGMAVAVVTTLLLDGIGNWGLIVAGLGVGTAVGVIASIRVQMTEITIFVLAVFVGFEVISKVPTTLHTPLMSQTNAIHGIVMLGGLIVLGYADDNLEYLIGTIAVAFGAINIVGGFMVTDRMLGMFSKKPKPKADAGGKGS